MSRLSWLLSSRSARRKAGFALWVALGVLVGAGVGWRAVQPEARLRWQARAVPNGAVAAPGELPAATPEAVFQTLASQLTSTQFLQTALGDTALAGEPAALARQLRIEPDAAPDSLSLALSGHGAAEARVLLQAIAAQASHLLTQQVALVSGPDSLARRQLALANEQHAAAQARLAQFARTNSLLDLDQELAGLHQQHADTSLKIEMLQTEVQAADARVKALTDEVARQNPALNSAREALQDALSRYTEEHPRVRELRAAVAKLEAELAAAPTNARASTALTTNNPVLALNLHLIEQRAAAEALRQQARALDQVRARLGQRLEALAAVRREKRELESAVQKAQTEVAQLQQQLDQAAAAPRYVIGPPRLTIEPPSLSAQLKSGAAYGALGGLSGALLCGAFAFAYRRRYPGIQTVQELEQAAAVPTIAKLGHLQEMSKAERQRWALETFTVLKGRAAGDPQNAFICGFTSANRREGTSTCVRLLAEAAKKQGYFTLVLDLSRKAPKKRAAAPPAESSPAPPADPPASQSADPSGQPGTELAHITDHALPERVVRLHSLDSIWDWQFRKQFQSALAKWNQADNLAVFIDLPPYSTEEGVVLAEKLPNLVWCCRRGRATVAETSAYMNTLRSSKRNLVGTVFNQAESGPRRKSFLGKWSAFALALALNLGTAPAQQPTDATPDALPPVAGLSVTEQSKLAPWQERLTLGPGDVLDISLYGVPDSAKPGLIIGPDGRINYLQARDILASDLTVDELRAAFEKALEKYHLAPKVVINPVSYNSKRYYILGNVMKKGGYLLDRPTTVIEAIAKSGGFVTAIQNQNVATLVDLERSFLVRKQPDGSFGKLPVNFEALFQRGDLTQNVPLAPGDYLFFPETGRQEIYVLGEVRAPGLFPYSKDLTALGAVAAKGGFTERAWKSKILVIRGSLNNPQTFVVDGGGVLKAKGRDFQLQNRDIVYVHRKPWAKAQEILEYGVQSFFRAAIIGYTGRNVGPFITEPIIK